MFNQPNILAFFSFFHRRSFQNKSRAAGGDAPAEQIEARGFHQVLGSACGNGTGLAHSALSTPLRPPPPSVLG